MSRRLTCPRRARSVSVGPGDAPSRIGAPQQSPPAKACSPRAIPACRAHSEAVRSGAKMPARRHRGKHPESGASVLGHQRLRQSGCRSACENRKPCPGRARQVRRDRPSAWVLLVLRRGSAYRACCEAGSGCGTPRCTRRSRSAAGRGWPIRPADVKQIRTGEGCLPSLRCRTPVQPPDRRREQDRMPTCAKSAS